MYNFGSIAFQSNRRMSIGTYTRVYNTFPSSISLVDLVEITASLIVSAYEALYFVALIMDYQPLTMLSSITKIYN